MICRKWQAALGFSLSLCTSLIIAGLFAVPAFAKGETFSWVDSQTIRVSGGDLAAPVNIKNPSPPLPVGTVFSGSGNVKHKSGCIMGFSLNIQSIPGPADYSHASFIVTNGSATPTCSDAIQAPYRALSTVALANVANHTKPGKPQPPTPTPTPSPTPAPAPVPGDTVDKQIVQVTEHTGFPTIYYDNSVPHDPSHPIPGEAIPSKDTFILCTNIESYRDSVGTLDEPTVHHDCLAKSAKLAPVTVDGTISSSAVPIIYTATFVGVKQATYDMCDTVGRTCVLFDKVAGTIKTVDLNGAPNGQSDGGLLGPAAPAKKSDGVCDDGNANFTELNYWVCGFVNLAKDAAVGLDNEILKLLKIDTDSIFNDSGTNRTGDAYFVVEAAFRDLSYVIVLLVGIVMVGSQMLGLDFVSAYTFRKKLFALVGIAILLPFLWPAQRYMYNFSNDSVDAVRSIISAPFSGVNVAGIGNRPENNITLAIIIPTLLTVGTAAGVAVLGFLGIGGIAALIGSMVVTGASAYVFLEIRNVLAGVLIVAAPLAVASRLFTNKLFALWIGGSAAIWISVPGLGGFYKIDDEMAKMAYINGHVVVAGVLVVGALALTKRVLFGMNAFTQKFGNLAAGATNRINKGFAKYRSDTMRRRANEAISGQRNIRGAGMATGLLRRGRLADQGGFSMGRTGRGNYREAEKTLLANTAAEMMKRDGGRSGGDDDAMELAQQAGMTRQRFLSEYSQRMQSNGVAQPEADRRAASALGTMESSFGGKIGSNAMSVAAYRSLMDSKTSYTDPTGNMAQDQWERIAEDSNSLMDRGLITSTDAMMAIKQRADRADRAGVGFGTGLAQIERSFSRYQQGARRGVAIDNAETRAARATLVGANPALNPDDPAGNREIARIAQEAQDFRAAGGVGPLTAVQEAAMTVMDSQLVNYNEATGMRREALYGTPAGSIVGGRHEAVTALAGTMRDNIENAYTARNQAQAAEAAAGVTDATRPAILTSARAVGPGGRLNAQQRAAMEAAQAQEQLDRQMGELNARYVMMQQGPAQNTAIMANNVLGQVLPGAPVHPTQVPRMDPTTGRPMLSATGAPVMMPNPDTQRAGMPMTVQEVLEASRGNRGFLETTREYMQQNAAAAAAQAAGTVTPPPAP